MSSIYKELLQVSKRKGKSPVCLVVVLCVCVCEKKKKPTGTDFGDGMVKKISSMLWVGM